MDKYNFISRLTSALSSLSEDERNAAVEYYKELFEDAGSERERDLIEGLETPEKIAENIIKESGMVDVHNTVRNAEATERDASNQNKSINDTSNMNAKSQSGTNTVLVLILLLLSSPIWGGVAIGILGALLGIVVAVFAVTFAFSAVAVTGLITGIAILIPSTAAGLSLIGIGLIFAALVGLICIPLIKLTVKFCILICNLTVKFIRNIFNPGLNKGVAA